ncbi:MAG TPA: lipid-binding SYLF domain-containing protein [Pyrinomonadaceae bacterium]|nr:lipid-binding SYLF domain-containing protein [Pyrinomonadaceae bacterium]
MKSLGRRLICALLLCGVFVPAAAFNVPAQTSKKELKAQEEAREQANKAAKVFRQIMSTPERAIPRELIDKAEAVAVFPDVIKAGFLLVGGRGGRGVISRRIPGGWTAPAFFNLGGGSIGPQLGASSTDFVLLFMNKDAVNGLLEDKFEIGGEGSIAAGPVGRAASASTDIQLRAGILSYSRSKGLFAGLELKGVVINPDNKDNEAVYGMKARELLTGEGLKRGGKPWIPPSVRAFPLQLSRYSRK